jgi:hypothetical protein
VSKDQCDLVIAIPARGTVRIEWAVNLKMLNPPVNTSFALRTMIGEQVDDARNGCVLDAREREAKYLMFIDDDVLIPNQGLRRMFDQMKQNPDWDLLSGIYVTKSDPVEPLVFTEGEVGGSWAWTFNQTFPITGCGMGCCLIRMSAFEKVSEPWFKFVRTPQGKNHSEEGEDLFFCRKLAEAGGVMMADGGLLCGHIHADTGAVHSVTADSLPIRRAKEGDLDSYTILDATSTLATIA